MRCSVEAKNCAWVQGKAWIRQAYSATTAALSVADSSESLARATWGPSSADTASARSNSSTWVGCEDNQVQWRRRPTSEVVGEIAVDRMAEDVFNRQEDEFLWWVEDYNHRIAAAFKWYVEEVARREQEAKEEEEAVEDVLDELLDYALDEECQLAQEEQDAIDCVLEEVLDHALDGVEDDCEAGTSSRYFVSELSDSALTEVSCIDLSATEVEDAAPPASAALPCKGE